MCAKFARPNSYNGKQSNSAWTGQVRAATQAEADAGVSPNLYISPATLAEAAEILLPSATESVAGIGQLASNAEAVAGTPSTGALALFVTPSNLSGVFAAPPAIGGTTPAGGAFTTLTSNNTTTIGNGSGIVTTIGNTGGAAAVNINVGTGNFALDGAATSTYAIGAATTTGTITVGGSAQTGTMTLGSSSGTNIVAVGAGTGATTVNIAGGAGSAKAVNIGTGAVSNVLTLGTETGAASLALKAGSGGVNVSGNLALVNVATQFQMNGGAVTDFIGRATLVAGTVTVANTNIAAGDRIFVTRSALNASPDLGFPITTISAATSFTIASFSVLGAAAITDISTFDYCIIRQT